MSELSPSEEKVAKYITEAIIWACRNKEVQISNGVIRDFYEYNERAKIIGLALGYTIGRRKGACGDKELAYADHYFQTRAMVAATGAKHLTQGVAAGYELLKKLSESLGVLDKMASDDKCPSPVSPDLTSVKWGMLGAEHGEADFFEMRIAEIAYAVEFWLR